MAERVGVEYTARERFWLGVLAIFGFVGVNGAFLWAALSRPGAIQGTLADPIATAFVVEAFVLAGVLAYLLARWEVSNIHWVWFVLLSLVGSILFALPFVLLMTSHRTRSRGTSADVG